MGRVSSSFYPTILVLIYRCRSEKYKFENWRLAFEVQLKLADHDKLEGVSAAWNARFEDSFVYKQHGKATDRTLKHIYLDFKSTSPTLFPPLLEY